MNRIRNQIYEHPLLLWLIRWARCRYHFGFNRFRVSGKQNIIDRKNAILNGVRIIIRGKGNVVRIGRSAILDHSTILVSGNNCLVEIGMNCVIESSRFVLEGDECAIIIGPATTAGGVHFAVTENGSNMKIGQDCMFAKGIEIRTGDSHGIFDATGHRLNAAQDVIIGDHVWVGANASILKGATIEGGAVVATRAVVTKGGFPPNSLIAGMPARVVRTGIRWTRERNDRIDPTNDNRSLSGETSGK